MVSNAHTLFNIVTVIFLLCMPYVVLDAILQDERGKSSVTGKRIFDFYVSCYGMGIDVLYCPQIYFSLGLVFVPERHGFPYMWQ